MSNNIEDEKDNNNYNNLINSKRITLYIMLGLIYSAFIGMQLGRIQAIADFNYNLHEIMFLPANLAIFIVPILFMIYLYYFIKTIKLKNKHARNPKNIIKTTLVILSLLIIFSIFSYQTQERTTSGLFEVKEKVLEERKYYIVLENIKIRVSYNEYNLIQVDDKYLLSFRWNSLNPEKGDLEFIEPIT